MIEFLQLIANIVQIVSGTWVLIFGGKTIFDFIKMKRQTSPAKPRMPFLWWTQAISVGVIAFLLLLYARPGAGIPAGTIPSFAVTTIRSTVSDGGVTFNKPLSCTGGSCTSHYDITLNTGTINTKLHRTSLTFTIVNANLEESSRTVDATLQSDLDPVPAEGVGNSAFFTLAPEEDTVITFQFDVVPYKGINYTVRIRLEGDSLSSLPSVSFDPYTFTFS